MMLRICTIALGSILFVDPAMADDTGFPQVTQIGMWECHPPNDGGAIPNDVDRYRKNQPCDWKYPQGAFADVPQLLAFELPDDNDNGDRSSGNIMPFRQLKLDPVTPSIER
jgi:hypothetical protein